jgi:predicted RNase H-like HicB family nuclease
MQTLNYRIRLIKEEEGGYTVIVPALPGCVTFGETIDEAIAMAREAIEGYIETLKELGKEVPKDNVDCLQRQDGLDELLMVGEGSWYLGRLSS